LDSERIEESTIVGVGGGGVYNGEAMERDAQAWIELCIEEFAIPRTHAARCSPLSEGWSCVVEWWKEGEDDGTSIGRVDEIVVVDGD